MIKSYKDEKKANNQTGSQVSLVPFSEEAERLVVSCLFANPDYIHQIKVSYGDFYVDRWKYTFKAMVELIEAKSGISTMTVWDKLEREQISADLFPEGFIQLIKLSDEGLTTPSYYIVHYSKIIERNALLRRIINAASEMARYAYGNDEAIPDDPDEIIAKVQSIVSPILISTSDNIRKPSLIVNEIVDEVEEKRNNPDQMLGLATGLRDIDKTFQGLQKEFVYLMAGRPGTGKTTLALSIILHLVKLKKKVGMLSLEMSDNQLMRRLLANEGGIDGTNLNTAKMKDEEWESFLKACKAMSEDGYLYIDDTAGLSPRTMRSRINRLVLQYNVDLLVVDYLQLIGADDFKANSNRNLEVGYVSRTLKVLARELKIPILLLSQLNREVDKRKDHWPVLSDLRDSGTLEQDADVIGFLYMESLYDKDCQFPNVVKFITAKHRGGDTPIISLYFNKPMYRYADLEVKKQVLE